MVNLHFSLLPRWRGAAPVERAMLAGDAETGVCLMQLEEGLDTGPVFDRGRRADRRRATTADELRAELVARRHRAARRARSRAGLGTPEPQVRRADLRGQDRARPSSRSTGRARPIELDRLVRLGGAWTTFRGQRLKVLAAEPSARRRARPTAPGALDGDRVGTGDGRARAREVQPEGKGRRWRPRRGATAPGSRPASALGT